MCEQWAARLLWALCACRFIARLQVTPLILTLRFEMAEPHRNAQAGGILQGLRLRGEQRHASHAGRAAVAHGGGCGWVHAMGAVGLGLWVPAAAGERLQPFGSTSNGRALLQGDCKMHLAEAEAQHAKCAKLNQLCFVDCFFSHKPPNK